MRIASNKIHSIITYFHQELDTLYPKEEIESFIFLCFEHHLKFSRTDLVLKQNDTVSESELLKFSFAVKALKNNTPIQYVLGNAYFCGLLFKVTNCVLIPRPETEELVHLVINKAENVKKMGMLPAPIIIDIGTGSGCIAVTLKNQLSAATVLAVDVSAQALEVATYNAARHKAEIQFIQADILDPSTYNKLPDAVDIIVSNPPYVKASEKAYMHKNVLDHEPHLALFVADNDALLFYKAIVKVAHIKLKQGGQLFFEINEALGEAVVQLLLSNHFTNVEVVKDIHGRNRMVSSVLNKIN